MIYILSYFKYTLAVDSMGEDIIEGYTDSKEEADAYARKNGMMKGYYHIKPVGIYKSTKNKEVS